MERELMHEVIVRITTRLKFREARDLHQIFIYLYGVACDLLKGMMENINDELEVLFGELNEKYKRFQDRIEMTTLEENTNVDDVVHEYGAIQVSEDMLHLEGKEENVLVCAMRAMLQRQLYNKKATEIAIEAINQVLDNKTHNDAGLDNLFLVKNTPLFHSWESTHAVRLDSKVKKEISRV
jgi:hypothetical protein